MPILEYQRIDLTLTIATHGWSLEWNDPRLDGEGRVVDALEKPLSAVEDLGPSVSRRIGDLADTLRFPLPETSIFRLVIRAEASLAGWPWEQLIPSSWELVVVRAAEVRLRADELPLTTPLRILQCDPRQLRVTEIAREIFAGAGLGDRWQRAVAAQEIALSDMARFQFESDWPTIEVCHMTILPEAGAELLAVGKPELPGSVGWLERFLSRYQTRLVVFEAADPRQTELGRRLGAALTARGGAAVLIVEAADPGLAESWLREFYDALFHDRPLDWSLQRANQNAPSNFLHATLFAGGGREEALRIGNVAEELAAIVETIDDDLDQAAVLREQVERQARRWLESYSVNRLRPLTGVVEKLGKALNTEVVDRLDQFRFEDHESGGFVPVVEVLDRLRAGSPFGQPIESQDQPPEGPRFVNARLQALDEDGGLRGVPPRGEALRPGPYFLAIDVGPRPDGLRAVRATAVLNEVLLFDPDAEGRWVEVAVSGIDFAVEGSPVQQLWVPAHGPSQAALFTVRPLQPGVNVLRYTVYADQNLVQSFKLAVFVTTPDTSYSALEMAAVLDLEEAEVEDRIWLSRLEFGTDVPSIQNVERRKVSIVSNELRKDWVITVKRPEGFSVQIRDDLADDVARIRDALDLASVREPRRPADRQDWRYAFDAQTNAGTDERLEERLIALAELGYDLFTKLIPNAERSDLFEDLAGGEQVIQVAHLLLEKVIPWSVIYDREFYSSRDDRGALCTAALPNRAGDWPSVRCGQAPCLLADGRPASSVVCPRHFWGFRHQIELPVQQIGRGGVTRPPQTRIDAPARPRVSVGLHGELARAAQHLEDLEQLTPSNGRSLDIASKGFDADDIVGNLRDDRLDLVYLYCHAEGGVDSVPPQRPVLRFRDLPDPPPQGPETRAQASRFSSGPMYLHHPLVILNGCRTAAFRPDTLSRFITTLVEDRWASGVLGTEISVFEQLATEVGLEFLRLFLDGESAGAALTVIRRRLLAKRNPLGLVYTLYADAALKLEEPNRLPPPIA